MKNIFIGGLPWNILSVLIDHDFNFIFILGGFDADPFMSRAWNNLVSFCERNCLCCLDFNVMVGNTSIFIPYSNCCCKWLDHIVGGSSKDVCVNDVKALYQLVGSDHLPVVGNVHLGV